VEWLLVKFLNGITSTECKADAKDTLRHYRRTTILNKLLDNKSALLTRPSYGVN
jgi:hypothetical protein